QTDLTFDELTVIAKDYNSVRKHTSETHLQGTSAQVSDQSMEVMKKSELQRVTNFIRSSLGLSHAKTGTIAYDPATEKDTSTKTEQDINNIGMQRSTTSTSSTRTGTTNGTGTGTGTGSGTSTYG